MDVTYFNSLMVGLALIAVVLAVLAVVASFLYFVFRGLGRISDLEKSQEAFQSSITRYIQEVLEKAPVSSNPGEEMAARRDQLLAKLRANEITRTEAMELNDILVREKQAAHERGDAIALLAVVLGLALLASVLAKSK